MFQVIIVLFISEILLRRWCKICKRNGESGKQNVVRGLFLRNWESWWASWCMTVCQSWRAEDDSESILHDGRKPGWQFTHHGLRACTLSSFLDGWQMGLAEAWWMSLLSYPSWQSEKCIFVPFFSIFLHSRRRLMSIWNRNYKTTITQ